jgi:hypothetical protein
VKRLGQRKMLWGKDPNWEEDILARIRAKRAVPMVKLAVAVMKLRVACIQKGIVLTDAHGRSTPGELATKALELAVGIQEEDTETHLVEE